jgi:WS/DGAT/MGAT family acyltransferase
MRQLAGVDAFHVLEESPVQHMHTMKIVVLDPSNAPEPITFEGTVAWAARCLPKIPPLRWRVARVPLGLGRPIFIDALDLDLGYHVRRAAVPAPGGDAEFDGLISDLASVQLDRAKPLWQLWFLEGLEGDRLALAFKMHHAIADGTASVTILEELFADGSEGADRLPPSPEAVRRRALLALALRTDATLAGKLPQMLRRTGASLQAHHARKRSGKPTITKPMSAPRTRFNQPLTPNRVYVNVTVPLSDLRYIKDALGFTLNDVFTAACGGALRSYLDEHGELPERSLTATVPVSLRGPGDADPYGNHMSYWYVSLATDLADPQARLAAVHESTTAAREWAEDDRALFTDWQDYYVAFKAVAVSLRHLGERLSKRPAFTAVVSNVRGPRTLSHRGARVVAVRSMGPIVRSQGINFTGWSYEDDFAVGIHACHEHLPDARRLADHLVTELDALKALAGRRVREPAG